MTLRGEAIHILEHCDPGSCGCGQPHRLPDDMREEMIQEMIYHLSVQQRFLNI